MARKLRGFRTALFAGGVGAALGFGAIAATASAAAAEERFACPGYTATAQICTDCCRDNWGGVGFWDSRSKYCNCAL